MALSRILYYNFKLNHNVRKDRGTILKQRENKFRRLLKYAFHHSDFYRKYYTDHGIHSEDLENIDIKDLPAIDKKVMMDHFDALNKLNPDVVTGYPTGIGMLAEMQLSGKLSVKPRAVICGGEPIKPETEELIQEVWGSELINYYAASESLILGVERTDLKGFYLFDDVNYIEFGDDHILLTNLYNYTQPLIRYRMNDIPADPKSGKFNLITDR